ncbi:MAG: response regulator transcription factor [Candidatus Fusobacterium pullicola]|uniref:Response regulator transcription factor n=1 Tax=Candidatus Fusobacterium pullicola TaxID=2838601 RepID=A0A9E2NX10_9FUSO|nr:response regulator transcription factor [Fusobacterium mortiferum]MBU3842278.1 response regulator transcription factor [Candidatus Fusobacterium pullicola]
MKRKILIIEDEKELTQVLYDTFSQEDFEVIKAFDGEIGVDKFYEEKPDLILLDINLPKKLGWEVCKEIRKTSNVPIIMMTARDSDADEYTGLSIGADDYITKPFNLKILLLKVKKLLKLDDNNIYKFESLSIDIKKGEINISGESIELTRREIQFLEYMIKNKGIIFSRDYLLNEIWGFDFEGDDRVVDTLVKRIRKKLGDYNFLLKTIRGMGYSFDENKN